MSEEEKGQDQSKRRLSRSTRIRHSIIKLTILLTKTYNKFKKRPSILAGTLIIFTTYGIITFSKDYIWTPINNLHSKYINYKKDNNNKCLANAFVLFKLEKYDQAEKLFSEAAKYSKKEDRFDIEIWLSEAVFRANRPSDGYRILMNSYIKNDEDSSAARLNAITKIKLLTAIKTNNLDDLKEIYILIKTNKIFNKEPEIQLLVLLLLNKNTEFQNMLLNLSYDDFKANTDKTITLLVWTKILELTPRESPLQVIALSRIRDVDFSDFDLHEFVDWYKIANLRLYSLSNKEEVIRNLEKLILKFERIKDPIYYRYKKSIIEFSMSIGSTLATKIYYQKSHFYNPELNIFSFPIPSNYTPIAFATMQYNSRSYLFGVFGFYDTNSELYKNFPKKKYLTILKHIIYEVKDKQAIVLKEFTSEDSPHSIQVIAEPGGYTLILKEGSGEFLNIDYFSITKLDNLSVDISKLNTYHSSRVSAQQHSNGVSLIFDSDLMRSNEANILRKVNQHIKCMISKGVLTEETHEFYNPAVTFFESLDINKMQVENFLMGSSKIQGKYIVNKNFIKAINDISHLYYKRSVIDDSYNDNIDGLSKELSALFIYYEPEGSSKDSVTNFLFLVKRDNNKVSIIDIFELDKNNKITKSVFE